MLKPFRGIQPNIGSRTFIEDTAIIIGDVTVESESSIWFHSVVRGDVHYIKIGSRTNIQDLSLLHVTHDTHPLVVGDNVTVGHRVILHGCTIKNRVLVGMGAILMDGVTIEEDCIIGAGALITEGITIPPRSLVLGSPARIKRPLTEQEISWIQESADNYVRYSQEYLRG